MSRLQCVVTSVYVTKSDRCHVQGCSHLQAANQENVKELEVRVYPHPNSTSPTLYQRDENTSNLSLQYFCTPCRNTFRGERVAAAVDGGYLDPESEPWICSTAYDTSCGLCGDSIGDWHQVRAGNDICDRCLYELVEHHPISVVTHSDRDEILKADVEPVEIAVLT